jgi:hypothetical protein
MNLQNEFFIHSIPVMSSLPLLLMIQVVLDKSDVIKID